MSSKGCPFLFCDFLQAASKVFQIRLSQDIDQIYDLKINDSVFGVSELIW